jgi:hypothetical protein
MSTTITRLVVTHKGELTRASAREFRALLRKAGYPLASEVTAHMGVEDILAHAGAAGLDFGSFTLSGYGELTPAQRGAMTRKRNTRLAKKAARRETRTGYVREQIRARKSA